MAYKTEYRGNWKMAYKLPHEATDTELDIQVSIYDTTFIAGDTNLIPVRMSGNPLTISIIDNDRDKFTPIKSRQAKIEILTENGIDFSTFSGVDFRWYVEITTGGVLFAGYLSLADMQQGFQPDPQLLLLTATDHLGMLKDVPMTNDAGATITGKTSMITYITACLRKTKLLLNTNVVNNLRHGTGTTEIAFANFSNPSSTIFFPTEFHNDFYAGQELTVVSTGLNNGTTFTVVANNGGANIQVTPAPVHESGIINFQLVDNTGGTNFYNGIALDALTFESEIGESEDCYSVLEKILGENCFLTQYNGSWWIYRVEEFDDNDVYVAVYDSDGVYSTTTPTTYNKNIGVGEDIIMALADELIEADRPHGVAKLIYNYEYPKEIPCNNDFSRGDLIDGSNPLLKTYEIDCWTLQRGSPLTPPGSPTISAYIERVFNVVDYEEERYIILTKKPSFTSGDANMEYILSSPIDISIKDRFNASIDWKVPSNFGSNAGTPALFRCILNGDDGSWWILGNDSLTPGQANFSLFKWWNTSGWTTNLGAGFSNVNGNFLQGQDWNNIKWESPPVPVSGKLYFYISQFNQESGSWDNQNVYYTNFRFDYDSYINGSYRKYSGQYQKVSRDITSYLAKRENNVYVSDSPKKLFKGGFFIYVNGAWVLTTKFYPYNQYPVTVPDDVPKPYGELQIRTVFNQYRNDYRIFSGSLMGLPMDWPDLIHKYSLTDTNPNTNDRFFMLTSFEQNWKTGLWSATFMEVWNTDGRVLDDEHEFKYITQ